VAGTKIISATVKKGLNEMPVLSRKGLVTLIVLVLGLLMITSLAMLKPKPQREPRASRPLLPVEVIIAAPAPLAVTIFSQGTVAPKREIDLVSQVAGRVVAVASQYANGGFFNADEMLLQIEPDDYEFSVTRAKAQVAKAQEQVALELGRSRQAKREWRELDDKTANALFLRQPQLNSAQASLESAQADLNKARLDLDRTAISAPFPGRIRQIFADLGQYVNPGARIAKVYSTNIVEVRLPLSDRQAALIQLPTNFQNSQTVNYPSVILNSSVGEQSYQWQGKIVRTDASIDIESRMTYAVAEIQNPFKADLSANRPPLNIGLFVQAEISGKTIANAITIPKDAVYKGNQILVLNQDDQVSYQTVSVIQTDINSITAVGVTPRTRIVSSRIPLAIAGMKVAPKEQQLVKNQSSAEDTVL
jgi:RND family efflux transporter MFP subunit